LVQGEVLDEAEPYGPWPIPLVSLAVNVLVLLPFLKYPLRMKDFAEFERFLAFDQDVLEQIVREGELMLEAQLATANAADQRALTYLGYLVATSTASVGAAIALLLTEKRPIGLIAIAFIFAGGLLYAAFKTLNTVTPRAFSFPGNLPENWITTEWNFSTKRGRKIKYALIEQCFTINQAICKNKIDMDTNASTLKKSIGLSIKITALAGAALFLYALVSFVPNFAHAINKFVPPALTQLSFRQ